MEFNELPPDTQKIAAETLKSLILSGETEAKKLAQEIREAFIALHQSSP